MFIVKTSSTFEVRDEPPGDGEVITKLVREVAILAGETQKVTVHLGEDGYYYLLVSDGFNTRLAGRYESFETF